MVEKPSRRATLWRLLTALSMVWIACLLNCTGLYSLTKCVTRAIITKRKYELYQDNDYGDMIGTNEL